MNRIAERAIQHDPISGSDRSASDPSIAGRERLEFEDFKFESFPDGRCTATVVLGWFEGVQFVGRSDGTQTLEGRLRSGARAALAAAESATSERLRFDLLGVKALKAFDEWIVIVSVRGKTDTDSYRLLGSYATSEEEAARGAALAVLDATNRILERYLG